MARAHRHYLAGQIWHLTHRCHQREFLLRFARDRQTWIAWLFEAKKRFGLCVLDYRVTSNHIHLLVYDREGRDVIPNSMQLVADVAARHTISGNGGREPIGKIATMPRLWKRETI